MLNDFFKSAAVVQAVDALKSIAASLKSVAGESSSSQMTQILKSLQAIERHLAEIAKRK